MKTKALVTLLAGAGSISLMASCSSPGANRRIEDFPAKYAKLSGRDKALVKDGHVARGMSKDAVWLAWGVPDRKTTEMIDGKPCEKWTYTGYVPLDGYQMMTATGGEAPHITFTGPLMAGDRDAGNQALGRVRDCSFVGDSVVAWNMMR